MKPGIADAIRIWPAEKKICHFIFRHYQLRVSFLCETARYAIKVLFDRINILRKCITLKGRDYMTLRIASAEIVSILFMLIILGSLRNKAEGDKNEQKAFLAFTLCTTFGLFFDATSYILDNIQVGSLILVIANIMAFSTIHLCHLNQKIKKQMQLKLLRK